MNSHYSQYWDHWAAGSGKKLGAPLIPSQAELQIFSKAINQYLNQNPDKLDAHILILGVTPKLVNYALTTRANVSSIDFSSNMIEKFWQGDVKGKCQIIHGDWRTFEMDNSSVDLILGDASLNLLNFASELREFFQTAANILKPKGKLIVRHFIASEVPETINMIIDQCNNGGITEYSELRFRLMLSMQRNVSEGIQYSRIKIDQALQKVRVLSDKFKDQISAQEEGTDKKFKSIPEPHIHINFPTLKEFTKLALEFFSVTKISYGEHKMAQRCPIIELTDRK